MEEPQNRRAFPPLTMPTALPWPPETAPATFAIQSPSLTLTAEEMARRYGVAFLYRDFRPGFRQGQQEARELGLYMQKYCGCVFSEEERYAKQLARDMQTPEKHL